VQNFDTNEKFFTNILWLYVILLFCFVQKHISSYESYFTLTVPELPEDDDATSEPGKDADSNNIARSDFKMEITSAIDIK
jgi:hypothetical protein